MRIGFEFPHASVLRLKVFKFETEMHEHDNQMKENDNPHASTNLRVIGFILIQS